MARGVFGVLENGEKVARAGEKKTRKKFRKVARKEEGEI